MTINEIIETIHKSCSDRYKCCQPIILDKDYLLALTCVRFLKSILYNDLHYPSELLELKEEVLLMQKNNPLIPSFTITDLI